jgi:FG-GAP repeat
MTAGMLSVATVPASAAAGCVAPDRYAHHSVTAANATGGALVSGAKFGSVEATGDFNGDGKLDIAVGAPKDTVGSVASGSVSVFMGSTSGITTGKRLTQSNAGLSNEAGDLFGTALAGGDFNKDGFADLAVGAPGEVVGSAKSGDIVVFPGSASGLTAGHGFNQSTGGGGDEAGDAFGSALAAGDFNGDGFVDLAIGVPGEVPADETAKGGQVYVYKGSASGIVAGWSATQESSAGSTEADDEYGAALAAGNVTGTSNTDLVVGAPGEAVGDGAADAGSVYVVPGAASGKSTGFMITQSDGGGSNELGDRFGSALAVANVDKDAFADIAVGVPGEAPASAPAGGSVMIFPGKSTTVDAGFPVQESQGGEAVTAGDRFGAAFAARDANGDGFADLLIGAPGKTYGSATAAGVSFLFDGGPRATGSTVSVRLGRRLAQTDAVMSNETNDAFGSAVALGDVTGDGKPEALIGAPGEAPVGGPAAGEVVQLTNLAPGAAPQVPLEDFSPTAAMQASPVAAGAVGALEYAYTDNVGHLVQGHQSNPADFSSLQWTTLSGLEAFAGEPSMAEQQDGRLQLVGHNTSSKMWVNTQATKDPAVWGSWVNTGGLMASHTTIARDLDGTLVIFAVDGDGVLWALQQPSPNAAHTGWLSLGMTGLTGRPAAVTTTGGIRVFARDTSGDIETATYAGRMITQCASLSGSGFTGTPTVVPLPGSTIWVFARTADGSIQAQKSDASGVFGGTWTTVGSSFTASGSPSVLLSPSTSKLEMVARADDGIIYSTGETLQGSGEWRPWVRAIPDEDPSIAATDPTAFSYTSGGNPTWSYLFRTRDNVTRLYTTDGGAALARSSATAPPTFLGHTLPAPPDEK